MLTAWEGLTPNQIAAVMGTPVNIVRVRLHRARARLKRELITPLPPIAPRGQMRRGRARTIENEPGYLTVAMAGGLTRTR
jgi:hypothetical protein